MYMAQSVLPIFIMTVWTTTIFKILNSYQQEDHQKKGKTLDL